MRCTHCGRPMLALFTSYVCDWCERPPMAKLHGGWVAWDPSAPLPTTTLVFSRPEHAEKWSRDRDGNHQVRRVLSEEPFQWVPSRGSMRDLELADKPYQVFRDHRYPPQPCAAFLAPPSS